MEKQFNGAANKGGIYRIRNKINEISYIGSTNRFKQRFVEHECSLKNHKHRNPHLQPAWDLYGEGAFIFEVLEVVEETDVLIRRTIEQKYIDEVWPNCYNVHKKTMKKQGPWSNTPEETRKKMSEAHKGKNNPMYGKKHTTLTVTPTSRTVADIEQTFSGDPAISITVERL